MKGSVLLAGVHVPKARFSPCTGALPRNAEDHSMTEGPLGYSITEARRRLGDISRASLYRAVSRHELELRKIGARSIITARSIEALLHRDIPSQKAA